MKTIHRYLKILITLCLILVACERDDSPIISEDPSLLANLLNNSKSIVEIGSNELVLKTYLYRDFMPSIPSSDKHPLIAHVMLTDLKGLQISTNLNISKIYVIKGNSIWISNPTGSNLSEKVSSNGPEWDTNIYVDVVVEIISTSNKIKYLLISKDEYIYRTE